MLLGPCTIEKAGRWPHASSNIVFNDGHVTIPCHLRDVVVHVQAGGFDMGGGKLSPLAQAGARPPLAVGDLVGPLLGQPAPRIGIGESGGGVGRSPREGR